jgi:hypothetical protein
MKKPLWRGAEKVDRKEEPLGFSEVLDLKNLLDGYLGHWILLATRPFHQLSDTKLTRTSRPGKRSTARFYRFGIYPGLRIFTRNKHGMFPYAAESPWKFS